VSPIAASTATATTGMRRMRAGSLVAYRRVLDRAARMRRSDSRASSMPMA
jgi:hypothetical protein